MKNKNYIMDILTEQLKIAIDDMRYQDAKSIIEAIIALDEMKNF